MVSVAFLKIDNVDRFTIFRGD